MFLNIFIASSAVAAIALIWRKFLGGRPELKSKLWQVLSCNFCLTYWIALIFTAFIFNPFYDDINMIIAWLSLGTISLFINFTIVLIQETIHYISHLLDKKHKFEDNH